MTNYFTDEFFDWNSSVIDSAYYDAPTKTLFVDFSSGSFRGYRDVPASMWADFRDSGSKGGFYNSYIRGQFSSFDADPNAAFVFREETDYPVQDHTKASTIQADEISTFTLGEPVTSEQVAYSSQITYDADVPLSVERRDEHGYTITFVTNGIEGQFNTDATSDEAAANEWRTLMDRLGLVATSAKVERDLV